MIHTHPPAPRRRTVSEKLLTIATIGTGGFIVGQLLGHCFGVLL